MPRELIPTSELTQDKLLQADSERVEWAGWLAMCEYAQEIAKCEDMETLERLCEAVNKRAFEIFSRLI